MSALPLLQADYRHQFQDAWEQMERLASLTELLQNAVDHGFPEGSAALVYGDHADVGGLVAGDQARDQRLAEGIGGIAQGLHQVRACRCDRRPVTRRRDEALN